MSTDKYGQGISVCLYCLNHGCGRYDKQHALLHYDRNIDHEITLNLKTFMIWCYECDNDLLDMA